MTSNSRQYDIVVLGATGYTGKWTAEHIAATFPTDLKWAIAGRSTGKLQDIVNELKSSHPDRAAPGIEESSLQPTSLEALAKKTTILITTVGPYALHGTPVVDACVKNGTHYFDVTGETPWVYDIVQKYHDKAKANKVIVSRDASSSISRQDLIEQAIPQAGIDSIPADILTWSLVSHIRRAFNKPTANVFFSLHKMKGAPSGGTLASALGLLDVYGLSDVQKKMKPWALSPIPPSTDYDHKSAPTLLQKISGVKEVSDLGALTTSLQGGIDRTQVYRSWGLIDSGKFYGEHFRFYPYMKARNVFLGWITHFTILFGGLLLLLSPFRALAKRLVTAPGSGPSKSASQNDYLEYRAIADIESPGEGEPTRAIGSFSFQGSAYQLTGIFVAEAAYSLLKDDSLAKKLGGGVLTPSTLGESFVERLQKAGVRLETRFLPN